jgi:hypothetical protein
VGCVERVSKIGDRDALVDRLWTALETLPDPRPVRATTGISASTRQLISDIRPSEWAVQRARYMTLETIAPLSEDPIFKLPAVAA